MPQKIINSANISEFNFSAKFDAYNQTVVFDTANTTYNNMSGTGYLYVLGICFSLVDQQGVELCTVDWNNPQINPAASETEYTLDLSSIGIDFFFQSYKIIGYIKDGDGNVYSTTPIVKKICRPTDITEGGYVSGVFQVQSNCATSTLTVKELTNTTYNNELPDTLTKTGTLSYPTGTIDAIEFTGTPFSNDEIFTGQYRVACDTVGEYNIGDDIYVLVTYKTDNVFDINCTNVVEDILCCISDLERTAKANCNTAIGERAAQQLASITPTFFLAIANQTFGRDASMQVAAIKKQLNCSCKGSAILRNEFNPINPSVNSIVVSGVGGTTVTSSISGNTKTFVVKSSTYVVTKADNLDTAFSITIDTNTANTVKYKIAFNYEILAATLLTEISGNNTLLTQFNSLIDVTNFQIDLSNLNGKCIIDLSSSNYFVSLRVPSAASTFNSIVINGTTYTPPSPLIVNNEAGIEAYLNGLSLGTFNASFSTGTTGSYINILSVANANNVQSANFTTGSVINVLFQKTNKSLIAFLQAITDYVCGLTSAQVALSSALSYCYLDYNGNTVTVSLTTDNTQNDLNISVTSAICTIANAVSTLTGVTYSKIKALFEANPNAVITAADSFLTYVGGSCVASSYKQVALAVIKAINDYTDVKTAYCAIDCNTPSTCPEIENTSITATNTESGSSLDIYGVTWTSLPLASQNVTVKYRVTGTSVWTVATNALLILPNGNVSGGTPYYITSGITDGITYDVQIINNCGGAGFIKQVTVPAVQVYEGSYLLSNIIYDVCGESLTTLYSSVPFGGSVIMYTDIGLTTPVTGYTYIAANGTGYIWGLNTSTGAVSTENTGASCNNGIAGLYKVSNNSGTICAETEITLYSDGIAVVGSTLFVDASLTTPKTGYAYVAFSTNDTIYNLATLTGIVGASTGGICP